MKVLKTIQKKSLTISLCSYKVYTAYTLYTQTLPPHPKPSRLFFTRQQFFRDALKVTSDMARTLARTTCTGVCPLSLSLTLSLYFLSQPGKDATAALRSRAADCSAIFFTTYTYIHSGIARYASAYSVILHYTRLAS